jgi:hypothetical protein
MRTRDCEQPLHAEVQCPLHSPCAWSVTSTTWTTSELILASEVISKSLKTNPMAIRRVSCSSDSLRSVAFVSLSSFSRCQCATISSPSFSSSTIQTHINDVKKLAGKLRKDGQGKQGLTIHLVVELDRLGSQATSLCSSSCNLHVELVGHRLDLELSLCFNSALLLK